MVCEEATYAVLFGHLDVYIISESVCTLLIHNVIPLYESHGQTHTHTAVFATERNTLLHLLYTLFDKCQNLPKPSSYMYT